MKKQYWIIFHQIYSDYEREGEIYSKVMQIVDSLEEAESLLEKRISSTDESYEIKHVYVKQ